ncbi:hypothetical protein [Geomobilimonas luticola]|uniref:Uncharacterized protein n=1 Tax=Geomobilimonas luticola TaxID=1114878 RepID=A0ABS5SHD8_9BACT|nr:hypothetical protein [Geomobilimonas luticola]MBT0654761.1 hypothetical protein [Geomobilimonas luticola]
MKVPQITIYSRNSGVEIGPYERRTTGKPAEGRIALRFFRLEEKSQPLRFVVNPTEGFELSRLISRICQSGGKETMTHKYEGPDGETVSKLAVERYERNNRQGYALSIQRGEESVNVSTTADHFLYAAEFLRHLSLVQAWVEIPAPESAG